MTAVCGRRGGRASFVFGQRRDKARKRKQKYALSCRNAIRGWRGFCVHPQWSHGRRGRNTGRRPFRPLALRRQRQHPMVRRELCESRKWHEIDWTGWYVEHYAFAANRPDWTSSVRHFDAVTALIDQVQTADRRDQIRVQPSSKATEAQIDWIKAQPSATRI